MKQQTCEGANRAGRLAVTGIGTGRAAVGGVARRLGGT